jgi:tRNA-dihydrouridine synthase B
LLLAHLEDHYDLYGEHIGVLSARKHIGWYVRSLPGGEAFRSAMNRVADTQSQTRAVADYFDSLGTVMDRLPRPAADDVPLAAMSLETP